MDFAKFTVKKSGEPLYSMITDLERRGITVRAKAERLIEIDCGDSLEIEGGDQSLVYQRLSAANPDWPTYLTTESPSA